jgi:hypothetical protein
MASIIMMMAGVFPTPGQPRNMKAKFMNSGYIQKWKQLGGQKGLEGKGLQRKIRFQLSASHSFGLVLGHGSHLCFRPTGDWSSVFNVAQDPVVLLIF